ncbi:MarR family winged helix-turn-helix transcriptional regulator [Mycobacterium asiaticum]|uniref:MarR family winged helix-turn-helix transcriptional regulator n=1 Tax=Mycobacterium asiaticum TaxID=1790 RepID=UPI00056A9CC0|nr:MarR family transcriptional regulator [Mycobacterium asiaticum]ORA10901.1 MarR family transcriptional regulator [Mycobacterium asiaticum DSM 44297]
MTSPESEPSGEEADCDLGWSVGMLMRHYRSQVQPCVADIPRGARGFQLLYTVIRKNLPNQLQMAEYLGIDRSVMPYVIDDLVEAGLVERQPDPADRRVRKVVATPLGVETFARLQREVDAAELNVLAALEPEEQVLFRSLLSRVARQARDEANVSGRAASSEDL